MSQVDKIISFLVVLIPPALVIGPAVADIFLVIIDILFLVRIYQTKNFLIFKIKFFKYFIIFYFCIIFSSLLSSNPLFSLETSIPYIRHGIFVLSVKYIIELDKKFLKNFFYVILITFICLLLDSIFQYTFGKNILGNHHPKFDRITSFFGNELKLGSYLSRLYPLLIALVFLNIKNINFKIFLFSGLIIAINTIVFMSLERTAFILSTMATILIFACCANIKKKIKYIILFFIVTNLILISTFNIHSKNRMINEPVASIMQFIKNKNIFTTYHQTMYETSFKMFKNNLLFGVGPRIYRIDCEDPKYYINSKSCNTHPHSTYMQLLAEIGIVGFLFFIIFVISNLVLAKSIILKKDKGKINELVNFKSCILITIFLTVWPIIPSGNFFNNWISIIYYMPLGFLYAKI